MGPITAKVEIDLPREQIFEQISDLALRPGFTEPFQSEFRLERLRSSGLGAAARFRVKPGKAWMNTEITELDAPHRLIERGHCGRYNRVSTTTVWELVELPSGLCQVSVTFFTRPARLFDRLGELRLRAERRHQRGWEESLRRLRELLESGSEVSLGAVSVAGGDRLPTVSSGTLAAI